MLVGVPKEIKNNEFRVGLVPSSVRELVHHGHQVIVETQAGAGIGILTRTMSPPVRRSSAPRLKFSNAPRWLLR